MKIRLLLLAIISSAMLVNSSGQQTEKKIKITGKVTDFYDIPVSNVLIMTDGKTTNSKTNNKGRYKIKVKPSVKQIGIFTTITGAIEEPINDRTVINFQFDEKMTRQLNETAGISDEEVVNQGYGAAKRRDITKPVTKSDVSGNEYSSFSSIYDVLATVPGVMVRGNTVTIRGVGTTGSSTPLFVVNGTPVNSISHISPSTVKSIEVLKGPSASVYGLQGANGVIMIRLKGTD